MFRALLATGVLAVTCGLVVGIVRVVSLERLELEAVSEWQRLEPTSSPGGQPEPHRELLRVELEAGEEVTFELCAENQLVPRQWAGLVELVVWHPDDQELVLRVPLDAPLLSEARRSQRGSCVVFAHAAQLEEGGVFALEAVWPGGDLPEIVRSVPLRARVLAHPRIRSTDRWLVVLVLVGAILIALGFLAVGRGDGEASRAAEGHAVVRLGVGLAILIGSGLAVGFLPLFGATFDLGRGLVLAAVQVSAALLLVRPRGTSWSRIGVLGLCSPRRARWLVPLAPLAGVALWALGRFLLDVIPRTGEAPIEAIVAWPSGLLAISLAGVVVPLAEEVFFRGFVFGVVLRRFGSPIAFATTVVLFSLAHLPQVWGAWGGLTAIVVTGIGLTALRLATGSTVAPALAHLCHNGAISLTAAAMALSG